MKLKIGQLHCKLSYWCISKNPSKAVAKFCQGYSLFGKFLEGEQNWNFTQGFLGILLSEFAFLFSYFLYFSYLFDFWYNQFKLWFLSIRGSSTGTFVRLWLSVCVFYHKVLLIFSQMCHITVLYMIFFVNLNQSLLL